VADAADAGIGPALDSDPTGPESKAAARNRRRNRNGNGTGSNPAGEEK
jgi:hypothetical protein